MPHRPIAHIYVKSWSGNDYGGRGKGKVLVGAECVSPREIKLQITQIKRDLDEVERKSIRKYSLAERAERGWVEGIECCEKMLKASRGAVRVHEEPDP